MKRSSMPFFLNFFILPIGSMKKILIVVILFLPYLLNITDFCNESNLPIFHSEVLALEKDSTVKEIENSSFVVRYLDDLFPQKSKVQKLLKQGNFAQAEKEIKIILDQDPENLRYQKAYAAVLQKNGNYDLSIEFYNKIMEKFPRDMDSRLARGRSFLAKRDYQAASQDFNYALERQKDNVNALKGIKDIEKAIQYEKQLEAKKKADQFRESNLKKAKILLMDKSYSQAIEIYSTLINKNEDDLEAKIFLARALVLNNQMTEAKSLYQSLKSKDPRNVDVLIGEGFLFAKEKNNDAAMANFKKALELDKNNGDASKGISLIKERIEGERRLVRIKTKNKKVLSLLKNVNRLIKKENYKIAEKILADAFVKYPNNTDIAFDLTKVKLFQKKYKKSLQLVNKLIADNPQDLDYLYLRGKIYVATNRLGKAELDFRSVLAKDTENKDAGDGILQIKNIKIQKIADGFKNRKNKFIKEQLASVENYLQKKNYDGAILW
jgi:tetratricopeptide (TPR) repeat protein